MAAHPPDRSTGPRPSVQFATTHWSLVLAAGARETADSQAALERLCRSYWPPLYAYVRRRVTDVHEAQDLTQAFFERLLEKGFLKEAVPQRGRFRAFLITCFQHFLSNQWERGRAQKRGAGRTPLSLDFASQDSLRPWEPAHELSAEQIYERQWAITLLNRVMHRLQRERERKGEGAQFQALKDHLVRRDGGRYAAVAAELGVTESAARMAASRLRRRYRELLREEIVQTVSSPEEIEDEIRHLFAALAG